MTQRLTRQSRAVATKPNEVPMLRVSQRFQKRPACLPVPTSKVPIGHGTLHPQTWVSTRLFCNYVILCSASNCLYRMNPWCRDMCHDLHAIEFETKGCPGSKKLVCAAITAAAIPKESNGLRFAMASTAARAENSLLRAVLHPQHRECKWTCNQPKPNVQNTLCCWCLHCTHRQGST